ncbi:hypothetical protein AHAS_Ahas12G0097200 [Arachis hypogaea]
METGVLFYELDPPFIFEDPMTFGRYYVFGRKPNLQAQFGPLGEALALVYANGLILGWSSSSFGGASISEDSEEEDPEEDPEEEELPSSRNSSFAGGDLPNGDI